MAFGAVHVPGPSGPDFVKTQLLGADTYAAGKVFSFGVIQQTNQKAVDFNAAGAVLRFGELQTQHQLDELYGEVNVVLVEVTLTNNKTYPFSSSVDSPTTVAISPVRRNLLYTVECEVIAKTGPVDEIIITDKALNGFKVSYTGSATSVTLRLRIKGGMT